MCAGCLLAVVWVKSHKLKTFLLVFGALITVSTVWWFWPAHVRVIGALPAKDVREIKKVVWNHVKDFEFPLIERDSLQHIGYVVDGIIRYKRLHILWIEVKDPNYVRVVVGINTNTIASDGWDFMVQKSDDEGQWTITGSAYWGDPRAAPHDFVLIP